MSRNFGGGRARAGFTLIELLVVIAIIGVLVALIMPAVQSARESANRSKCQNNLKQLALAMQEYHDALGSFPSGWYCYEADQNCVPYGAQSYMWNGLVGLFPYLEQKNLYNELNMNFAPNTVVNTTSIRRTLDFFVCPSNRKPNQVVTSTGIGSQATTLKMGPSDYRGNMAAGTILPCTDPNPINCFYYDNGITYRNSEVTIADITDGTTFTLLLGETLSGTWPDAPNCCVRTTLDRTLNKPIKINGKTYNTYWSSKHPSMVNFAKCDGSVAPIKENINKQVLIKLMTRAGDETISSEEMK